jgi:hypothetical protein
MSQDLTTSVLRRQNVLNNPYALQRIEQELDIKGLLFEGMPVFTMEQAALLFDVDKRTIERIVSEHNEELSKNGYHVLRSIKLKEFKGLADAADINVGSIDAKASQLSIFNFRALLNLAMLLPTSERARMMRTRILDIVTRVVAEKAGNRTFINQRDEDYLPAAFAEENHRKEFTDAVSRFVEGKQWKYKHCTDAIYKSIFQEKAAEYRKILQIEARHNVRDTFYAEALLLIASYECGLPEVLEKQSQELGRQLSVQEAMEAIEAFGRQTLLRPQIEDVRRKMASRDYSLRDAIHTKLEAYIQAMPATDYERFLGEKSKALEERINESLDVYKRLRDR